MNRIAQFEKVSFEQFKKDWIDTFSSKFYEYDEDVLDRLIGNIYNSIKLPKRATSGSAGYDFFCPYGFMIQPNNTMKIPTGIRCKMESGWVLKAYPRSGHGFKYGTHLANTVGIIDEDYYNADNEGHIKVKLSCDPRGEAKYFVIKPGDKFCQGIIREFFLAEGDDEVEKRDRYGGMGSTGN